MKLRTLVSLLLFLIGLAPLLAVIIINVPLVYDRLELFYHKAYLQNLRADFRDLDQHIGRRHEMVLLLAKLPEPGMLLKTDETGASDALDDAHVGYTDWVNRVLFDQMDIVQIVFLDESEQPRFWLDRDPESGVLRPGDEFPDLPGRDFLDAGTKIPPGTVLTGPIKFDEQALETNPNQFMTLSFIAPVVTPALPSGGAPARLGSVVLKMDIGGLAGAYRGIYWVHNNGSYLARSNTDTSHATAFEDFPGLEELFAKGELNLWEYKDQQIFWVPLFPTEKSGPLWVGRSVDASPVTEFRRILEIRVISIGGVMLLLVFLIAWLIATRVDRFSRMLTEGISNVLEQDEPVEFRWKGPRELKVLGSNLTQLAQTHAKSNEALRLHARALEESNRYKSEFLANVSHELRTPLNAIIGFSEVMGSNAFGPLGNEKYSEYCEDIHKSGQYLLGIISDILDMARLEAGRIEIEPETINVGEAVAESVSAHQSDADATGIRIETEIPEVLQVEADRKALRQILFNLVSNAIKFSREDGLVTVRANASGDRVSLTIEDNGIGIAKDALEKLGKPFEQVQAQFTRNHTGSGLGLAIARSLAQLHGGDLTIASALGEGTTVTVLLPAVPDDLSRQSRTAAA